MPIAKCRPEYRGLWSTESSHCCSDPAVARNPKIGRRGGIRTPRVSAEKSSQVLVAGPSTASEQFFERVGMPSTRSVHAPQTPCSQPRWVPSDSTTHREPAQTDICKQDAFLPEPAADIGRYNADLNLLRVETFGKSIPHDVGLLAAGVEACAKQQSFPVLPWEPCSGVQLKSRA